jgi:chromosome segregation ATPase
VQGLEAIVKELSQTNATQFENLQAKTAEFESGRNELETLRGRTKELEFQLREALERCAILEDSSARPSSRRDHLGIGRAASPSPSRGAASSPSPMEVQRLLAEAEARSEAKISDLRNKILSLEGERNDAEEEWAAKLSERVRELEKLRRVIAEKESESADSLRSRRDKERLIDEAEEARKEVEREMKALRTEVEEARASISLAAEAEVSRCQEVWPGAETDSSALHGKSLLFCRRRFRISRANWTTPKRIRRTCGTTTRRCGRSCARYNPVCSSWRRAAIRVSDTGRATTRLRGHLAC